MGAMRNEKCAHNFGRNNRRFLLGDIGADGGGGGGNNKMVLTEIVLKAY
jgi:hypothetical protein